VRTDPDAVAGRVTESDPGELASPARKAPAPVASTPPSAPAPALAAAEARAPSPSRDGGIDESAAPRRAELPPPRRRRKVVAGRASLLPTFVLSAVLALVVAASVFFG